MIMYTNRDYSGGRFMEYINVGVVALDETFTPISENGKTVFYGVNDISDFKEKLSKNTNYVLDPEEVLADNFSFVIMERKDLTFPEVIDAIVEILQR